MSQVYNSQSLLTIELDTKQDLTNAANPKILYEKPSKVKGSFAGTKSGTKISYIFQNNDLSEAGLWKFQAYYEDSGGKKAYGTIRVIKIESNLSA